MCHINIQDSVYFLIDLHVIHDLANGVSSAIKMQRILTRIFSLDNKSLKVKLLVVVSPTDIQTFVTPAQLFHSDTM